MIPFTLKHQGVWSSSNVGWLNTLNSVLLSAELDDETF